MSVFTSDHTKTLPVPGDPDHAVTIRKLAPRHLEAAAKAAQFTAIADFRAFGGSAVMKDLREMAEKATAEEKRDPLALYDRQALLEKGVIEWTLGRPLSPENLADLDDDVQIFYAREIVRLSKPKLFQSDEEAEADRKNAAPGSTAA